MSALRFLIIGGVLRFGSSTLRQNAVTTCSKLHWGPQLVKNCVQSRFLTSSAPLKTSIMSYSTVERGAPNSLEWRMYFKGPKGNVVSPFHDIPLYANTEKTEFNMVVEVPRWTNAKLEINTKEKLNPIKQDVKKGNLRYVKNCFPHHGYIWNYGALPQTWEDPSHTDDNTKCKGDNDPLDVCEIGHRVAKIGDVIRVKVLGTLALIDEGETDWKVLVIDVKDPMAQKLNDIADIEKEMPGFLENTFHWFRIYKIPDGKPENEFAFDSKPKDKAFALKVIEQTHQQWQKLMQGKANAGGVSCENVTVGSSAHMIDPKTADSILEAAPPAGKANPIPTSVDIWHFVESKS